MRRGPRQPRPGAPDSARTPGRLLRLLLLVVFLLPTACNGPGPLDRVFSRGETLRVQGGSPSTLDPSLVGDSTSWSYALQIFSGLVRLDDRLEVVPDLAERWETSQGGRAYRFFLRPNIRFHDGREVTAADFKYAFERTLAPATGSTVARLYLGDIVGADDVIAGQTADLRGVRVEDARTLRIEIDAPKGYFLAKLTHPTAFVLDRANVETGRDWFRRPVGTGPFRLTAWEPEQRIELTRFDRHWAGPARLAAVEFNLSPVPGIVLYETGEIDVAAVGGATLPRVSDPNSPLSQELVETPLASTWYLAMNAQRPPFDDPRVRRAFALATDRERLVQVFLQGVPAQANSIVPPGLPGHSQSVRPLPFDPARARQELASSRYGQRLPEIVLSVGPGSGPTAEAFAEMFARNLGVEISLREHGDDYHAVLERREAQLFLFGWIADYPDPENFLDILFHSRSPGNHGGYASPELDALLEQARVEPDQARRFHLYEQAERHVIEQAAAVPIHHEVSHALVRPYVRGLVWSPLGVLSYHGVEVVERASKRAA